MDSREEGGRGNTGDFALDLAIRRTLVYRPAMQMVDIDATIAKKQAAIRRLQEEIATLGDAKRLVTEETEPRGSTPKLRQKRRLRRRPKPERQHKYTAIVAGRVRRRPVAGHPMKGVIVPDSDAGRARHEIIDAGKPLHINVILDKIEQRTGHRPKRTSLVGALARYAKEGRHFVRTDPNTFGVMEKRK